MHSLIHILWHQQVSSFVPCLDLLKVIPMNASSLLPTLSPTLTLFKSQSGLLSEVQRPFPGRSGPLLPVHNSRIPSPTAWVLPIETSAVSHTHCSFTCSSDWHTFSKQVWPITIPPVLNSSLLIQIQQCPPSFCKAHRDNSVSTNKNYRTGSNLSVLNLDQPSLYSHVVPWILHT